MARGEYHPNQIAGLRGGVDRHGVATLVLPLFASSVRECYSLPPKTVEGLPLLTIEWAEGEGGLLTVQATYGGDPGVSGGGGAGGVDAVGAVTYSLKPQFGEEPIETHPLLKELMDEFGGTYREGRVYFPTELPEKKSGSGAGRGVGGAGAKKSLRNPMSGVEKWKPVEVRWFREYAARSIPGDILSRIGKAISNPPGNPPGIPGRTKWLVEPPETNDRGNVVQISESYLLLPEDAPESLYQVGSK